MENLIHAESLSRYFGQQLAVNKISLTVARGEVVALLGTNGAGKTTTLQLLTGELIPSAGRVTINNIDLNLHPCRAKRSLGYLPDVPPLYGEFTVDEFLSYCARLRGLDKLTAQKRVKQVKDFCELHLVSGKLIRKLSKGFKQRVGIAQAIIHKPSVIILDEPTNGLDPSQIYEMRDLISHLKNDAAILLSTHQLNDVEQICNRVLLLRNGEAVFCKSVDELRQANKIRVRFSDLPPKADIEAFSEIYSVQSIDPHTLDIFANGDLDVLKNSLLAQSQLGGWNLVEIYDIHNNLEDLFVNQIFRAAD